MTKKRDYAQVVVTEIENGHIVGAEYTNDRTFYEDMLGVAAAIQSHMDAAVALACEQHDERLAHEERSAAGITADGPVARRA